MITPNRIIRKYFLINVAMFATLGVFGGVVIIAFVLIGNLHF